MSKFICACLRRPSTARTRQLRRRIAAGAARIQPPGVRVSPALFPFRHGIAAGIVNPATTNLLHGASVALGCVARGARWHEPGTPAPEGAYAICRGNARTIELLSDAVASRTLWYYVDESMFVASTSQRWLACVLGEFVPNERALTWMLVTGSLGPTDAWDARVRRLPPDSVLTLDREAWTTRLARGNDLFEASPADPSLQRERLRAALRESFDRLSLDLSRWVLPLSGGCDSRGILCLLPRTAALKTITWGTAAALENPRSDAAVARRLAGACGVAHDYFRMDLAPGSFDDFLDLFVANGEGRTDHISGYLDGFAVWKTLAARGVAGIIRGDEGFGWKQVSSREHARKSVGLLLWSDFGNLPALDELGLAPQEIPDSLRWRRGETPEQWRDRLYHGFRIPTILAALTDLKAPFVEIANPLLTHAILRLVRGLADRARTEKRLFREIVDELGPDVPYATEAAIAERGNVLRGTEAVQLMRDTLGSQAARRIVPPLLLDYVAAHLVAGPGNRAGTSRDPRKWLARCMPAPAKRMLRRFKGRNRMDLNTMALRVCIVCRTHELFRSDAGAAREERPIRRAVVQ